MFTRCKECHTVHPVNASVLSRSGGKFRCGKCNKVNQALESLFDEWPGAGDRPESPGEMPVLGLAIDLEQAEKSRVSPPTSELGQDDGTGEADDLRSRARLLRIAWVAAAITIVALTATRLSEFYGPPLLERPEIRQLAERLGLRDPPPQEPFRDLAAIHLVSRELKSHPTRNDMLRLTATIVNRAVRPQPFPRLEVTLLDLAGEPVASRNFTPADYLDSGNEPASGMTPEAYLSLVLDLEDPGVQAVGFELEFH